MTLTRGHRLGSSGIKGLGRAFRIWDDDRSHSISVAEASKGLHDYGVAVSDEVRTRAQVR